MHNQQQIGNLGMQFNAAMVDPSQSDGQLPEGVHKVIIERGEVKGTQKDAENGMLVLTLLIIEGASQGSRGAMFLNIFNKDTAVTESAHRTLSALCHVTGQMMVTDSSQLCNIPFCVQVSKQKSNPAYMDYKVLDANGQPPRRGNAAQQTNQAPPAQQPSHPPAPQFNPQGNVPGGMPAPAQVEQQSQQPAWGQQQQSPPPQQQAPVSQPAWGQQQQAPPEQQQPPQQQAAPGWQQTQQAPPAANPPWQR